MGLQQNRVRRRGGGIEKRGGGREKKRKREGERVWGDETGERGEEMGERRGVGGEEDREMEGGKEIAAKSWKEVKRVPKRYRGEEAG